MLKVEQIRSLSHTCEKYITEETQEFHLQSSIIFFQENIPTTVLWLHGSYDQTSTLCMSCIPSAQSWSVFPALNWRISGEVQLPSETSCTDTAACFIPACALTPLLWLNWHFRWIGWQNQKPPYLRANLCLVLGGKRSWLTQWKEGVGMTLSRQLTWVQLKVTFHG